MGPLDGLKIVELAGIGPAPMSGMLLSDLGAKILRIDRPVAPTDLGIERPLDTNFVLRGRETIRVDLKDPNGVALVLRLCRDADALIEGFRPGVVERLGIGPDECMSVNPRLVFGRVTGWGQAGPLAKTAGHDLNYIGLSGVVNSIGRASEAPAVPLNLIGDFAGGAMFLSLGVLAAIFEAKNSGKGQVVDAAIVDGVASMMNSINGLLKSGIFSSDRGANILDSGAFYYDNYLCSDGKYVSVGAVENRFFLELLDGLGLDPSIVPPQDDRTRWAEGRAMFQRIFITRSRDEWAAIFAESDACVSPVLSVEESEENEHLVARNTYVNIGGFKQGAPAPRFSRSIPDIPKPPQVSNTQEVLLDWLEMGEVSKFAATGVI